MAEFTVFEFMFNNEKIEKDFIKFFKVNNLDSMFTDEHRTSPIKVRLPDAQSVINDSGKYAKDLLNLSNILSVGQNNKMYNEATFKIINEATSFQKMMNNIRVINPEKTIKKQKKWYKLKKSC